MSLIELLLVVTILGLLAVLATGGYRVYTQRAHRTEALTALLRLALRQEDYRLVNHTYSSDLDALGFPDGCSEHCVYTVSFTVPPDTRGFAARAVPTPGGGRNGIDQSGDDDCQWFEIDARGRRAAGPGTDCWSGR